MADAARLQELVETAEELARRKRENRLAYYRPYPKQAEFHALGKNHRERLFLAGNQLGKTLAGSMEVAAHLTGRYPEGWKGRRFERPVTAWVAGVTGETTRDTVQRHILGPARQHGTGAVPKDALGRVTNSRGLPDAADTVMVRHMSGGWSELSFKAYEKGREKWQAATLDLIWFDEEPPADIYAEGLTRTNASGGLVFITATPLLGMTDVIARFMGEKSRDRAVVQMTIDDAGHISAEDRERIIASYAPHEVEARTKGVPMLGSGRVFPVPESMITVDAFELPAWWPRVAGLDFGWDHPTAAVWLAWNREADEVFVYDAYRASEATPVIHAAAIKARGDWIPVAWPHDGLQHEKGTGETLAALYKAQGVKMRPQRAQFSDGGNSVEAGVMDMLQRMQTGRLKVFSHLHDWFEEFRIYHRKDGRIVKVRDDLMSATRYALMDLRFARTHERDRPREPLTAVSDYDMFGDDWRRGQW